jgi:hypothetical protein
MVAEFSPWETKGQALQRWIENAHESDCPCPKSAFTLTYKPEHPVYVNDSKPVQLNAKLLTTLNVSNDDSAYRNISITQRGESPPTW